MFSLTVSLTISLSPSSLICLKYVRVQAVTSGVRLSFFYFLTMRDPASIQLSIIILYLFTLLFLLFLLLNKLIN